MRLHNILCDARSYLSYINIGGEFTKLKITNDNEIVKLKKICLKYIHLQWF